MMRIAGLVLLEIAALALPAEPQQKKKKKKQEVARWSFMELGPVFSSMIKVGRDDVAKGIALRLGDEGQAAVCFDEDLVRISGGWTGGFVHINPGRDALLGNDRMEGTLRFTTPALPGWATPGEFSDPRTGSRRKAGPLPRTWARYKGLYMHGKKVVLSYTVGKGKVLEHPWAETVNGETVFTRTFEVSGLDRPTQVLLAEEKNKIAVSLAGEPAGVTLGKGPSGTIVATVTPEAKRFKVVIGAASSAGPVDLAPLTKGGPRRWTKTVTTRGRLGRGPGAYVVDTITPPFENPYKSILHFGGHDFFPNGDAAICTMEGDVWLVKGIDDDLDAVTWQRIATGLYHPLGLKIVGDDLYVLCRDQIARLHDLNGDGEIDFYECFNNDSHVGTHAHEFATCLETGPTGDFYYIKGTNNGQTMHDSSLLRVSADGSTLERFATGFRWPNGLGVGPEGEVTAADQQGTWVPASRLDWVERGGFYGYMNSHHRETTPKTYDGPLCWIPHFVDNSCGGQVWVKSDRWGPLNGQMLHLSYGKCELFLVLHEKVGGSRQGGVVKIPVGPFASGAMRGRFRKADGQLYVSGLKGWQTSGARDGCFQRVRYTGRNLNLPVGLNATRKGIRLRFSDPLDKEAAPDPDRWSVERWNYRWTRNYGSPLYSVADPSKRGKDEVFIKSVRLLPDGKTVFLEIEDMKPVMQMAVTYGLKAADGSRLRGSVYHTIHALGEGN